MQVNPLFNEIIIMVAASIASAVIGYLVALVIKGRVSAKLDQVQKELDKTHAELTSIKIKNDDFQSKNHQWELSESKLQEQLANALATETRLSNQLVEQKNEITALREKLDYANQNYHSAEKRYETSQADIRGLNEQIKELRERFQKAEIDLQAERKDVGRLKEELSQEGKNTKASEASEKEARQQLAEIKIHLSSATKKYDELQDRFVELSGKYTKLQAEQEERQASHAREVANFEKQKASLSEHFKVLSNEILEVKTKSLQESSKLSLSAVMNPFQQSIDSFKKEVQDIHHRETTQQGELRKELESLKALNQQITAEAHELSTALRGQKKLQGNWGELVLENVLDRSGLQLGKDRRRASAAGCCDISTTR
jgi:DNA recombination protein RmuC